MTREELEEIKARAEGNVYYFHAKRDVHRLLAEVERLQGELRAAAGCVAEVLKRCGVLPGYVEELGEVYGNLKLSHEEE